ncbi:MAG: ParB N-terminal domain-containing protein [Thermoguttaceae bacterium]|nr:ParB N-terminal domain-containing protein [Thermoguttaceae bacterium]
MSEELQNEFKIDIRPIESVRPYDKNPRLNDKAVDAVAASLQEFGFRQPIVVDSDSVIICGHTRFLAAKQLGLAQVPVHVATDLTPEQVKAYRIADNKTGEIAQWDFEILPIELSELQNFGFDMTTFGFSEKELTKLLETDLRQGLTDPDAVPEPPDDPVTQKGDLWILGNHRLLCGDSASEADVDYLLNGVTIDLCNTDPPYNVRVEPRSNNAIAAGVTSFSRREDLQCERSNSEHGKKDKERTGKTSDKPRKMRAKDRPLENDFMSDEAFAEILNKWFGNISRVLKPGGSAYIWGGYANLANYPPALKNNGLYFSQCLVWDVRLM